MTKKESKRKAGKRFNEEKRLSPLDALQKQLEYYQGLFEAEVALGNMGSRERADEYSKIAKEVAKELAPYRCAKIATTDPVVTDKPRGVIRARKTMLLEDWLKSFNSLEAQTGPSRVEQQLAELAAEKKAEEQKRREELLIVTLPPGKPN